MCRSRSRRTARQLNECKSVSQPANQPDEREPRKSNETIKNSFSISRFCLFAGWLAALSLSTFGFYFRFCVCVFAFTEKCMISLCLSRETKCVRTQLLRAIKRGSSSAPGLAVPMDREHGVCLPSIHMEMSKWCNVKGIEEIILN